jgi:hypothetical protein
MIKRRSNGIAGGGFLFIVIYLSLSGGTACGYDVTNKFSIGGVLAGAWQYLELTDDIESADDGPKASAVLQPQMRYKPDQNSELFAKFGFADGNGLNVKSPFALTIWATDLEDDVKDINGRNRDYLLTAWGKWSLEFSGFHSLGLSGGIIDSTDYMDTNAFANNEYTQFLKKAFVNAPTGNFVSYDIGAAGQWRFGNFSANGVIMDVGKNNDGNNFQFYALQLAYRLETALGEGNYRITGSMTSDNFLNAAGDDDEEALSSLTLSIDQQLGKIFGAFLRLGIQDDAAAITWENLYSGGLNISGDIWGREQDNIGIGIAYLDAGNTDPDSSLVTEINARFGLNEMFAASADFQYLADDISGDQNPKGWVGSIRLTAEF